MKHLTEEEQRILDGWDDEDTHYFARELDTARGLLPNTMKLRLLADWLDLDDVVQRRQGEDEVQRDLRAWADAIDAYKKERGLT